MKKLHREPYTIDGFKKIKMPKDLYKKLLVWYLQNEKKAVVERKYDNIVGTIRNVNKQFPATQIIHLHQNKELTTEFNKVMLEEVTKWSGVDNLIHTSTYGIRMYERGDVLISHTDRPNTHILSAICSIWQEDMDEPWALEIKDPDGWWHEVYFEPGDMVFYESDILEHGRMRPLKGHKYANMYVHFKPEDYNCGCGGQTIEPKVQLNENSFVGFHNASKYQIGGLVHKDDEFEYELHKKQLTKKECNDLIKEFKEYTQARTHAGNLDYDKEYRKAYNAVYNNETPLLRKVREVFAAKTGTHIDQQEVPISIIKYEEGGEYKPHHDYYTDPRQAQRPEMGNRWKTAILYLNDDYEGGETQFPSVDVTIKGNQGDVLTWTNLNKNRTPNTKTLHAGLPVTKGTKYIVVTWIREGLPQKQTVKI